MVASQQSSDMFHLALRELQSFNCRPGLDLPYLHSFYQ